MTKQHDIYFSFNSKTEYNDIIDLIRTYLNNFSIIDVSGYYNGVSEVSKCLRIIDLGNGIKDLDRMIESMKLLGNQECILHTVNEIEAKLI